MQVQSAQSEVAARRSLHSTNSLLPCSCMLHGQGRFQLVLPGWHHWRLNDVNKHIMSHTKATRWPTSTLRLTRRWRLLDVGRRWLSRWPGWMYKRATRKNGGRKSTVNRPRGTRNTSWYSNFWLCLTEFVCFPRGVVIGGLLWQNMDVCSSFRRKSSSHRSSKHRHEKPSKSSSERKEHRKRRDRHRDRKYDSSSESESSSSSESVVNTSVESDDRPRTLVHYVHDRTLLIEKVFTCLSSTFIDKLLPEVLQVSTCLFCAFSFIHSFLCYCVVKLPFWHLLEMFMAS